MTDPLGVSHWAQPKREAIVFVEGKACMASHSYSSLREYSTTMPSGVYPGKMWKAAAEGTWCLRWYEEEVGGSCRVGTANIAVDAGAMFYNPYSGKLRDLGDLQSDPKGILIYDGVSPVRPAIPAISEVPEEAVSKHVRQRITYWQNRALVAEGAATNVPSGDDGAVDEKLGLVKLPPIRLDNETHDLLTEAADRAGVIVQAYVRKIIAAALKGISLPDKDIIGIVNEVHLAHVAGDEQSELLEIVKACFVQAGAPLQLAAKQLPGSKEHALRTMIFTALGQASMQWEPRPSGVFDSSGAFMIGEALVSDILGLLGARLQP